VNDDDDMVALEVSECEVRELAARGWPFACRWVEANDRPERRVLLIGARVDGFNEGTAAAVAVEDLQPGDRVAGREVRGVENLLGQVRVQLEGQGCNYAPGTLVVLDPSDGAA
jgi:hypothetical protein